MRTGWLTDFFAGATLLGDPLPLVVILLIVTLLFWQFKQYLAIGAILLGVAFTASLQYLIKVGVARLRPDDLQALVVVDGYSFPSGHVAVTTILFLLIAHYLLGVARFKKYQSLFYIWAFFIVVAVALSRVYLGVHWPSDTLAGFILGLGGWGLIIWLFPQGKLKSAK